MPDSPPLPPRHHLPSLPSSPPLLPPSPNNNNNNKRSASPLAAASNPYTSTPAPSSSSYLRSQSTIIHGSSSSRLSDATTIGAKHSAGRPLSRLSQHHEDHEPELPSFEDDGTSGIEKVNSMEDHREDMVVLSGSGTESEQTSDQRKLVARRVSLSPRHDVTEDKDDTSNNNTVSSQGSLNSSYFRDPLDVLDNLDPASPLPRSPPAAAASTPERDPHDYSLPLSDDPEQRIPASERARRLSFASANISIRRKPSRKSNAPISPGFIDSGDTSAANDENGMGGNEVDGGTGDKAVDATLPSTFSPLRELNSNRSDMSSPGMGRHSSPHSSFPSFPSAHSTPFQHHQHEQDKSVPLSRIYNPTTPLGDSPLANAALPSTISPDAQRRAAHLLSTLRSTAKPRLAKGTPHPVRRAPQSEAGDSVDSEPSSHDLTTIHHGNTSLPSGGGGGVGVEGRSTRFNGAKLNAYLHSLNTHLTEENQSLVKTLGSTTKEVQRLKKRERKLEDQVKEMSRAGLSVSMAEEGDEAGEDERSRVQILEQQLEGLVESHEGINGLQRQLVDEMGGSAGGPAVKRTSEDIARIAELEQLVASLERQVTDKDSQVITLRDQLVDAQALPTSDPTSPDRSHLVQELQREVFELKDLLGEVERERDARSDDVDKLRQQFTEAGEANTHEIGLLHGRSEELLLELERKDEELDEARRGVEEQENDFACKMEALEKELCRVLEEQEKGVEEARKEVEMRRHEDEEHWKVEAEKVGEAKARVEHVERELEELTKERDALLQGRGAGDDERLVQLKSKVVDLERTNQAHRADVVNLEAHVRQLEGTIDARDDEITKMNLEMDDFEKKLEAIAADEVASKRLIEEHELNLKQTEEALDESAQMLIKNEEDLESLRQQLASEKNVVASLTAQISQLSRPKAKSPLANEVYNSNKDSIISSLEGELEAAQAEILDLKHQIVQSTSAATSSHVHEIEIRTLESHKLDLEDRVNTLRQQVSSQLSSPRKTPDKSVMFRSIVGVQTPKTPGQFMSNLSAWSPGVGDTTISPLLAQIDDLESIVAQLQSQLAVANDQVDSKIDKLEAAGTSTISLARQLADARTKISLLEAEWDKLVGEHGSLERVRTRLTRIECPGCTETFDANKIVQLRFDRSGVAFSGSDAPTSPQVNESLRTALAGVNAKLSQLRTENTVLQDASTRAKELAAEKSSVVKQHAALQKDFQKARSEIAGLEVELQTERTRLRTLANEQTLSNRAKLTLETRLSAAESELRNVKRELANATPEGMDRLRREKADLVLERADLLQQLNLVNERASQVDSNLHSSKSNQMSTARQLSEQLAEISRLRESLLSREAEKRLLQDERGDILRGVAGLQADLNRVRQDAISLGLDLANVRRERDEIARPGQPLTGDERAQMVVELEKAKRKLAMYEVKVAEHVCPSDVNALAELTARHKEEAKGLLVWIRYLKFRCTREATFRADLAYEKSQMSATIVQKQATIDSVMSQLGLPTTSQSDKRQQRQRKQRPSLRAAVLAVISIQRMSSLSREWKRQETLKMRLRTEAYPDVRGRPYPSN